MPAEQRFMAQIQAAESGCLLWTGAQNAPGDRGYGTFSVDGRRVYVHRFAYERAKGPIPKGLTVDHLCRTRLCVNPDHLEVVSMRDNTLRGNTITARFAAVTHCRQGHPYDLLNTRMRPGGGRRCRACDREQARARRVK